LIVKRIRERIGTGRRIYNSILGIILLIIGLMYILNHGFSIQDATTILKETYVLIAILLIVVSIIGLEPFITRYRLKMDNETIRIKKTFERELKIDLKKITYLKIFPSRLEITYNDFVKTYDFSWLTPEEVKDFQVRLSEYCLKNKIETN
jgi:SNF family Na+-dependent transporter